ncbi:MAG: 5-amino-6-(5-phosphoribosylamino)uracil reductase [Candidatus Bathyarchaeum sp.]|nr:MAG: 5-amino-6-(5-phosphoribosylamino)uracil reductase [Candidatus Bathyarchaeum sp.]
MFQKIILHNSVSLDGSLTNFDPNMELHYQIAGKYNAEARLIGSNTVKVGIELYGGKVPPEEETDFIKPERGAHLPFWVIPDTKGILKGLLHTCRRFEFCRDVIVLVSEETPTEYVRHLEERNYDYHVVGNKHVDLEKSLEILSEKYDVKTVLADTGRILGNLLLNQGFVSEISLLVHPVIVGKTAYNMFSLANMNPKLRLRKAETLEKNFVWLVYSL